LINVSGGQERREWPTERTIALIRAVQQKDRGISMLVVGAPWANDWVRAIADAAGVASVATPEPAMVMSLVATADFVFTPDTSIAHMAAAFCKPAVAMYLEGTAAQWGVYQNDGRNLECVTDDLTELSLETVLAAVEKMLDSVSPERSSL
jgi:ADP-heptose:LPS heptosyltransferase